MVRCRPLSRTVTAVAIAGRLSPRARARARVRRCNRNCRDGPRQYVAVGGAPSPPTCGNGEKSNCEGEEPVSRARRWRVVKSFLRGESNDS